MKNVALSGIVAIMLAACNSASDNAAAPSPAPKFAEETGVDGNGPPPPPDDQLAGTAELTAPSLAETDGITEQRLSFERGSSSVRVDGSITGYETIDYLLNVRAGQAMNISMVSPNSAAFFNLLEPGETEVAIFNGSNGENMYEGVANESGDYRIRVYLYRSAARRKEKASYGLEVIVI